MAKYTEGRFAYAHMSNNTTLAKPGIPRREVITNFEQLLDGDEAARLLHLHPKTLERLARAGQIPAYKVGKRWLFRASELDGWLRSGVHSECHPCRCKGREFKP
jgi:excisionase family DNA binding protein